MSFDPTPQEQTPLSHYIQTTDKYGRPVNIPVIDVRDGLAERMLAESIVKATNRSKYMNYTEYHISHKKAQNI